MLGGQPPLEEEPDELLEELLEDVPPEEELLDEELEELDEDELDEEELEDDEEELELDEELLDEPLPAAGTEHSLTPPATRPPNVASLHTKLPLSSL